MFGPTKPKKKVTFHSPVITSGSPEPEAPHQPSSEDNSDIESTRVEVGTDDELDDSDFEEAKAKGEEKMSSTDDSSDTAPEWTQDEDRIICVRKSQASSWAEIGKELARSRRECQQRYRMLSSHAKELGITTEKLAKLYIEEKAKPKKGSSKSKKKNKTKYEQKEEQQTKSKKDAAKSGFKSETKSKSKKRKNAKAVSETSASASELDLESESDLSSSDEEDEYDEEEEAEEDSEEEFWAQRRYIYDELYGQMYPDQKVLRPDRFYSKSDCRVLAGLEARYRANKWLHIQADFANATGRMVEAEILKAKFYEDEN